MFYCLFDLLLFQNIWKKFTKRALKLKVQSFLNLDAAAGNLKVIHHHRWTVCLTNIATIIAQSNLQRPAPHMLQKRAVNQRYTCESQIIKKG